MEALQGSCGAPGWPQVPFPVPMTSSKLRNAGIETMMTEMAPFRAKARPDTANVQATCNKDRQCETGTAYEPQPNSACPSQDINSRQ